MEIKELNYLIAIAEEKSISKAAERLYMAQSSLSQFLFQYEAELGAKLFVRTARGVRPTSAGEVFIDHARQILYSILVNQENTMQSFLCTMIRDISLVRHLTSKSL